VVRFVRQGSASSLMLASAILPVSTEARLSGRTASAGTTVAPRATQPALALCPIAIATRLHSGALAIGATATIGSTVATPWTLGGVAAVVGTATVVTIKSVHVYWKIYFRNFVLFYIIFFPNLKL